MKEKKPIVIPEIDIAHPGKSEQFWIETDYSDKTRFWAKRFYPTGQDDEEEVQPKSTSLFVHGFVEYIDRYRNIFKLWPSNGHEIIGFDQRGWGNTWKEASDPQKNYGNTTWPQAFQDLDFIIRLTRKRLDERWGPGKVPLFLIGHSMGGGIVTAFNTRSDDWIQQHNGIGPSQEAKDMIAGIVACAPWLTLTKPPPWIVIWAATKVLSRFPEMHWNIDLLGKNISRDPVVAYNFEHDPLTHKKVFLKTISGPLYGGMDMVAAAYKYWPESKPLLLLHGTADLVTSPKGTEQFYERVNAKDKTLKLYEGYLHDLLQEPGQDKVMVGEYIVDWLNKHI